MKLNLNNLNWNSATVLNFNFLVYLALMLDERTNGIGLQTFGVTNDSDNFRLSDYQPGGFFRFELLYNIYVWTLYIGKYYYFNSDNLSNDAFKNGHRIQHFGYSIDQLSEIADFEFNKNPLIPGQRLDYYDKFLKPLYLVLKEYKKIWVNLFYGKDTPTLFHGANLDSLAKKEIYNIEQDLTGQDLLDYYSLDHAISSEIQLIPSGHVRWLDEYTSLTSPASVEHDITFLGGLMKSDYQMFYSFGYMTTVWEPDPGPGPGPQPPEPNPGVNGNWKFYSANAHYNYDGRYYPPGDTDIAMVESVEFNGSAAGNSVTFSVSEGTGKQYYGNYNFETETGSWELLDEYPIGPNDYHGPVPAGGFAGDGTITVSFGGESNSGAPPRGATIHSISVSFSRNQESGHATITIYFEYFDEQYNDNQNVRSGEQVSDPPSGHWANDGYENDYATNYEGLKFNFYSVIPSTQIQCPIPLLSGASYQLYMYSFTFPVVERARSQYSSVFYDTVHRKIRRYFYYPESDSAYDECETTDAYYDLYQRRVPTIQLQPFGNYFLVEQGTINNSFNCFNITLPSKLPYTQNIFDDYPVKLMGDYEHYQQVDYVPYSYDQTQWEIAGSTPTRDYHNQYDLTSGSYLNYIGQHSALDPEFTPYGCFIEWWYRPLLICDYESKFEYI